MKRTYALDNGSIIPSLTTALALILSLVMIWGIAVTREKILHNANHMGSDLAQSYANQERARLDQYKALVATYADSLDSALARDASPEEIQALLAKHAEGAEAEVGEGAFDVYAVVDGEILAAVPWEGDDTYSFESTEWYQLGLVSETAAFTDIYTDVITGRPVVTIAMKLQGTGNVLAVDVLIDRLPAVIAQDSMPKGSAHYLLDSTGTVLFTQGDLDLSSEEGKRYLTDMVHDVRAGVYDDPNVTVTDVDGTARGVYFFTMDNGWLSIVTIPLSNIIEEGWDLLFVLLGFLCTAVVILMAIIFVRERRNRAKNREMAKTLTILGDRYYAIYQANLETERYQVLKDYPEMPASFPRQGWYGDLLAYMRNYVEQSARGEFSDSFSLKNIKTLIKKGISDFGGDFERKYADGYRWVNVRCVYNSELSKGEFLLLFREIDDEKRAEVQHLELIKNALETAHQTENRKNEFFSKASHDMRTPLNAIIGLSTLMEGHADDADAVRADAAKIRRSGQQLLTLVNDILDLSRMDAGADLTVDSEPFDLARCIAESVEMFHHRLDEEGKVLKTSGLDRPVPVYGDELKLARIFNNLVSNAVKYTDAGDEISVSLRAIVEKNAAARYQVTIADTGTGMSAAFLEHIFEPFSRETRFAPAKVAGTGLGMPIVKSLVQRMSGEITVASELGKGTTFVVTLPLPPATQETLDAEKATAEGVATEGATSAGAATEGAAARAAIEGAATEGAAAGSLAGNGAEGAAAKGAAAPRRPEPLAGLTVLVAEDNDINMEIVLELLGQMGAHTLSAVNGDEALHVFSASKPGEVDVILMDMHMPVMDGCQASEAIRALDRADAKTVTIIAVTANVFAEDIARTTQAGMDGHLAKPIDPATLGQSIASILERKNEG